MGFFVLDDTATHLVLSRPGYLVHGTHRGNLHFHRHHALREPVRGYPTLIVSVLFFGGIQLISLGVLGEYLGRVYEEVKARPLFIVAETVGFEPDNASGASGTGSEPPRQPSA